MNQSLNGTAFDPQIGECVEYYPGGKVRKHWSKYNNAKDCTDNGGKWMMFTNFLEKMPPQYNKEKSCKDAGDRFVWAIPHGSDKPQCLVKLDEPYCGQAPWTRDNHLGNTPEGVTPNFTWTIPNFPSGQAQLCVFRIRYSASLCMPCHVHAPQCCSFLHSSNISFCILFGISWTD